MTTTLHRTIAVLKLPTHVPDLIKVGHSIIQAMTNNAALPNPTPPLANVSAVLAALDAAETATKTRAKGTVEARNTQRAAAVQLLHELKGYVQQMSDAHPSEAATIIASALMQVKKAAVHVKHDFVAKPAATSGSVHLAAKAASRRASYEWQWSADGGKSWQQASTTLQARTVIPGLPVATSCQFRYRAVTKTGETDWSQPTSLIVK